MAMPDLRSKIGSSLRVRVFIFAVVALALLAMPAWFAFNYLVNQTVERFGTLLAEKQVEYDRYRGLETLNAEITLAETMARSPAIIAWAQNEANPSLRQQGIAELEHFRLSFSDRSVFLVIDASGNYYFNDAENTYAADPYQYTVRADNPRDGWYFATRERREGCFANVDHDDNLRVTKVWINCLISHEGRVLGILGTGLDLTAFIREVVDIDQPGVNSIFVDQSGAVQAHRDASLVDFHSLTKDVTQRSTVFSMFDTASDGLYLRAMMNAAFESGYQAHTAFLNVEGRRVLVGVGYLDRIGWYNITILDPREIVAQDMFLPIGLLLVALLLSVALALSWVFKVMVLNRIEQVEKGLVAVRDGKRAKMLPDTSRDEIGRLSRAVIEMSDTITEARMNLESQIRERTEQLESLVNLDSLTGIYNRRGFATAFDYLREQAEADEWYNGLILIDIDHFKSINDSEGHLAGDQVVVEVARRLTAAVRRSDICGRWGGDEFIVVIRECDPDGLRQVATAMRDMMRKLPVMLSEEERVTVTVSIGAAMVAPGDTLEMATDMADAALYTAKENGRDCVVMFDPDPSTPLIIEPEAAEPEQESA